MQIFFQYTNFKADRKLLDLITQKLNKLETFYDRIIDATVYLKVENADDNENKCMEVKMNVSHQVLFTQFKDVTFENCLDRTIDALKIQLVKYKEKMSQVQQ
jgi:putative sigma-54 modulation protein